MKKITLLLATALFYLNSTAQDSTEVATQKKDTIRIGNIIIVKKGKKETGSDSSVSVSFGRKQKYNSKVSTNWFVLDLGFANYNDQTDYSGAGSYLVNRPGYPAFAKSDFKLKAGKSVNVNIWFVMQRLSLVNNYLNLKYGLGLELNNYRYKTPLSYREAGV